MIILIVGCRRSGTTIFWRQFRQDPRFVCYDEPFNPLIVKEVPHDNPKKTRKELIKLHARNPELFWQRYTPITPSEEALPTLRPAQADYLRFLSETGKIVVIDTTRCHLKLRQIVEIDPHSALIHLHRGPAAFASSHLVPSGQGREPNYDEFWEKTSGFNKWNIEEIIGADCRGPLGHRILNLLGYDPKRPAYLPAILKLLAYWKLHFDEVEQTGARSFGERFLSVRFEDYCRGPEKVVDAFYSLLDLQSPAIDLSEVHAPKPAHFVDDPKWYRYASMAGLQPERSSLFRDAGGANASTEGYRAPGIGTKIKYAARKLDRSLTRGALLGLYRRIVRHR